MATNLTEAGIQTSKPLRLVGIGASAGGLVALETLLARLTQSGAAYLVVQHQAANENSFLVELLARVTPLRVLLAADGAVLDADTVYVAPPALDLVVEGGVVRTRPPSGGASRDSVDVLFRSLAADVGAASIAVVLSGTGADGTEGLRAVAAAGGVTFAQTPSSAGQPGMPQSALDSGCVTFSLPPSDIADELIRQLGFSAVGGSPPTRLHSESVASILRHLRGLYGVDFTAYKLATIERRIERRMVQQHLDRVEDYARFVLVDPKEPRALYDDILIGVSSFFRDVAPFEALITTIFPRLFAGRAPALPLRIWVPATAGGEEAYSVAMCLLEFLGPRAAGTEIQIFASDIDDAALKRARAGRYGLNIQADVSPERLARFFTPVDGGYQISSQVRDLVVFTRHDLAKDPPFSRLDLISCRNVLIYMQPALQQRILRVFHYALRSGGFLLLGASSSVGDAVDLFTSVDRKLKLYQKKDASSLAGIVAEALTPAAAPGGQRPPAIPPPRPVSTALELADRKVLERYGPPGVLLNSAFEVIQFRGQMGVFLDPIPGKATFNILKLIRADLLSDVRSALMAATTLGAPVESGVVAIPDGKREVQIDVLPLSYGDPVQKCFLVLFRQAASLPASALPEALPASESGEERRLKQVERELLTTREFLDTAVQDLRTANEELQSANEELQSRNEELQSANEELETSREELTTMNEELHNRISQLAANGARLGASTLNGAAYRAYELAGKVLSTLPGVMALLDAQLRLVWVNKAFFDTFEVGAEVLGLPLAQVWAGPSTQPKLWASIEAVVAGGAPFTKVVAEHPLGAGDRPSVCYSTRRFAADGERAAMTLLVIEARDTEELKP